MKHKLFAHKNAANIQLFAESRKYFDKKKSLQTRFFEFLEF